MRGLLILTAAALLCAAAVPAAEAIRPAVVAQGTAPRHLRADGHVALAWLYGGSSDDYRRQVEAMPAATVLSPTWWYLQPDEPGALEDKGDPAFVTWAHERGLAVWPLFGNHVDPDLTERVLRDDAARARVADELVAAARRVGADGINVDFENLYEHTAPLVTELILEVRARAPDLVLSADVGAMTDTYVLGNWSLGYDRPGLGRAADYVMLMAYDQHNTLRRNGPVAGLQWVEESVEFLLRTVPAHKVVLGLPFYVRDWADDPHADQGVALDATLGMAAMGRRLAERSEAVVYDPVAGQDLHSYVDSEGRMHRVWHEDVVSLERKAALVGAHGLAGIAAWRAGFEDPEVWAMLDRLLAGTPTPVAETPAVAAPATPADSGGEVTAVERRPVPAVPPEPAAPSRPAPPLAAADPRVAAEPSGSTGRRLPLLRLASLLVLATGGALLASRRAG